MNEEKTIYYGCTEEDRKKYDEIGNIIDLYKDKEGSLIQILHLAQEIYGYLPLELQKFIACSLNKPLSEVSGVITFYSFFPQNQEDFIPSGYVWGQPAM